MKRKSFLFAILSLGYLSCKTGDKWRDELQRETYYYKRGDRKVPHF